MSAHCHRFNTIEEIPHQDVYLFYNMRGGKFYVERQKYEEFSLVWSRQTNKYTQSVTMDLAATEGHALMFDLDFVESSKHSPGIHHRDMFPNILSNLKMLLLPHLKHFTYIIAFRDDGHGIHVHVPECVIGHDDYILLCEQLHIYFKHTFHYGTYQLDIPVNMTLPGATKPNQKPYLPKLVTYVDEKNTFELRIDKNIYSQLSTLKTKFKRVKDNANSYFRQLLFLDEVQNDEYVFKIMMPVPSVKPLCKLAFTTMVSNKPNESEDYVDIAECVVRHSNEKLYISKGKSLLFNVASHFLKASHYLKLNSFRMTSVETNNHALKQWFKRHYRPSTHIPSFPVFDELNNHLRASNTQLFNTDNPIKKILEFDNGYYFLPVFYALCQCLHISSLKMVDHLRPMLSDYFIPLLDRLELVDEAHTNITMKDLTTQTINFCGNNLGERFVRHRDKLQQMVQDSKRAILSVHSSSELVTLIRGLQESHFPIQMLKLSNSLRRSTPFIWNCLTESWQELSMEKEKESHLINLWNVIKSWLKDYRRAGHSIGGPDDETIQKFQIGGVLSMITSDTSIERKVVQMDRHKWFIRTEDGLLDILTGHVGGTVPELFLSDRKLGIGILRTEMNTLINDSEPLVRLYELLTTKSFFQTYLKALFTDQTDDLFGTVRELIIEKIPHINWDDNAHAISMMHFYVHLCKYTAFDYDLLMYLCDVLASIFIATNYERKFFVCKGQTSNGKSKLFEILGSMMGGYYHCIQSDNLKPGNASTNASPDLASTLFNCRIVTTEELEGKLNENRVKQITGNSCVVFRNMYEASQGGIPTAKLFTTTNNLPDCQSTEAFRDRVVAIPFLSRFVDKAPTTTSEQVRLNRYGKGEYVIEQSHIGCFLLLIYHLKKYMDVTDGLLHYRDAPPSVVEFTEMYLYNTDVYNQFKTYMDIQMYDDGMTTMTELRSAIRQFLKNTKNNTTAEPQLILKFEEEFRECRKLDETVGNTGYASMLESDEPSTSEPSTPKRLRVSDTMIYYENVVIRNLRRYESNN